MKLKRILSLAIIFVMLMPITVVPVLAEESDAMVTTEAKVEVTAPIAVLMDGKTRKSFV